MFRKNLTLLLARVRIPEPVRVPWGWLLGVGLGAVYLILFFMALLFSATAADMPLTENDPTVLTWASFLSAWLLLVVIWQNVNLTLSRAKEAAKKSPPTFKQVLALVPSTTTPFWVVILMVFGLAVIVDTVGLVLNVPSQTMPIPLEGLSPNSQALAFLVAAVTVVVLRPMAEELLFRGVLYTGLLKSFTPWQSITISTLLFVIVHYVLDSDLWWGLAYPLAIGLTAGIVRASTKSTTAAIGAHAMYGLFVVLRAMLVNG